MTMSLPPLAPFSPPRGMDRPRLDIGTVNLSDTTSATELASLLSTGDPEIPPCSSTDTRTRALLLLLLPPLPPLPGLAIIRPCPPPPAAFPRARFGDDDDAHDVPPPAIVSPLELLLLLLPLPPLVSTESPPLLLLCTPLSDDSG